MNNIDFTTIDEQLEEYGDMHEEGCLCMAEDPDECTCDMNGLKPLVHSSIEKAVKEAVGRERRRMKKILRAHLS